MKQEKNHIDEQFHLRLYGAEVAPPAFVWPEIERELRKRRRRVVFFWLFGLALTGAGTWAMLTGRGEQAAGSHTTGAGQPTENTLKKGADEQHAATGEQTRRVSAELSDKPAAQTPVAHTSGYHTKNIRRQTAPVVQPLSVPTASVSAGQQKTALPDGSVKDPEQAADRARSAMPGFSLLDPSAAEPLVSHRSPEWLQPKRFVRKKKDSRFCYDFTQHPTVWLVDVYAGPSFAGREIESNIPAYDAYRQQRLDTEQKDFAFNAGVRGSLLFGRHFLLRSGLHYEQMTEVFEYADPNYVKYLVEITHTTIDGKPVTLIDTVGVEYGENYVKTYNRYRMLDIPVEGGLELRRGRFGLSLNGGISLNVFFWKRGTILSPGGKPLPFTPGEKGAADVFRARTGLSLTGSAQVFFHIKPRLRVFAEPYFRQVLKPVTLDDQPVEQRYRMGGIKIGLTRILD